MCAFLRNLISTTSGTVKPLLLGDWNEECIGKSNCKKLCDEFGLVDLFAHKYPNHDNFKTYQQGTKRIDIAIGHIDLAGKVKKATYEPFGFRKGMGDHRGNFYDILEKDLFSNDIDNIYRQNKGPFTAKIVNRYHHTSKQFTSIWSTITYINE